MKNLIGILAIVSNVALVSAGCATSSDWVALKAASDRDKAKCLRTIEASKELDDTARTSAVAVAGQIFAHNDETVDKNQSSLWSSQLDKAKRDLGTCPYLDSYKADTVKRQEIAAAEKIRQEENMRLAAENERKMKLAVEQAKVIQQKALQQAISVLSLAATRGATHIIFGYQCNMSGICQTIIDHYNGNMTRICRINEYIRHLKDGAEMDPMTECLGQSRKYFVIERASRDLSRDYTVIFGGLRADLSLTIKLGNIQIIHDSDGQLFEADTFYSVIGTVAH